MTTEPEETQTLRRARALIARPGGWTRHRNKRPRTLLLGGGYSYCMIGALREANGPGEYAATCWVQAAIRDRTSNPRLPIFEYNDNHADSKKDVLSVLDEAIKLSLTPKTETPR